jgi:hypothetical protein
MPKTGILKRVGGEFTYYMKKIFGYTSIIVFAFYCQSMAIAQSLNNINALKFSSTAQFDQIVGTKSVAGLQNITGFSSYTSLESIKPAESSPDPNDDVRTENDGYDVSKDLPAYDKNDYSAYFLLSYILNADKIVVIGNWIIKVDLINERVLVLNTNSISGYNDLLNDNLANTNIINFSTEDEVIELINQMDNGVPPSDLRPGCPDRFAAHNRDAKFFYTDNRRRLDAKAAYQAAGIIFSLEAKGKTQKRFLRIWWQDGSGNCFMSRIELDYEIRCKKGFSYWGDPSGMPGYSAGSTCHYQPYLGTRALKSYHYHIDFNSTHGSGHVGIEG